MLPTSLEFLYHGSASGLSVYAVLRNFMGWYYNRNTDDWEQLDPSNWTHYVILLYPTYSGSSFYRGTWHYTGTGISLNSWYHVDIYNNQLMPSAAQSTNNFLTSGYQYLDELYGFVPAPPPPSPLTIDGISWDQAMAAILSTAAGKVSVTDNHDGTYTAQFMRQDGTTPALTVTYDPSTGVRTATGVIP